MSVYQNVVGGRLRLKGKPLQVLKAKAEADVISKKKRKKRKHRYASHSLDSTDGSEANAFEDHLTPAERKFLQRRRELELQRLEKMAIKSHHDRILEFNQYLANITEHYDIPKVGPG